MMQEVKLYFQKKNGFYTKEAFKTLRSNIEFSGDAIRVIAVTSCMAHEGKSSVASDCLAFTKDFIVYNCFINSHQPSSLQNQIFSVPIIPQTKASYHDLFS